MERQLTLLSWSAAAEVYEGQGLDHEAVPGPICPVRALARRVYTARQNSTSPSAPICLYGRRKHVVARHISQVLQRAAIRTTIWMEGFCLKRIGTHSICPLYTSPRPRDS